LDGPAGVVVFDVVARAERVGSCPRWSALAELHAVVDVAAAGGSVAVPEPAGAIPADNALGEVFRWPEVVRTVPGGCTTAQAATSSGATAASSGVRT
jgi:hypothetical protein